MKEKENMIFFLEKSSWLWSDEMTRLLALRCLYDFKLLWQHQSQSINQLRLVKVSWAATGHQQF